ncbi:MAG: HEAT repeat domain-containing protein [Pseudonocardiaceae bacterium]
MPEPEYWVESPLIADTEAAVRDVLTAVESRPAERVDAAAALATLSPRLVPEAARALENLSGNRALVALAQLGGTWWHRVRDDAERAAADDSLPQRERHLAATVLDEIGSIPSPNVLALLREVASDERVSDLRRVNALVALRRTDGPGQLRILRDDERARPALRWRVTQDLAKLGVPGRDAAAAALRSLTADETLPVTARAQAARLLAEIRPGNLREALTILRGLADTKNPLHRRQVLLALGSLDTTEAVPPLLTMLRDHALTPGSGPTAQ